jgi:hypothetical protein
MWLEKSGKLKKFNELIGIQTRDFPACSIVPQPTMPPRDSGRSFLSTDGISRISHCVHQWPYKGICRSIEGFVFNLICKFQIFSSVVGLGSQRKRIKPVFIHHAQTPQPVSMTV